MARRRGCIVPALTAYGIFLGVLVVLPLGAGYLYSERWLPREEEAWAGVGGATPALLQRFPRSGPSEAALQLDDLSRSLGIDFLGSGSDDEEVGAPPNSLNTYSQTYHDAIRPPPPKLADFLATHGARIAAIERLLLGGGQVSWETDLEAGSNVPLPSLQAHKQLQAVLSAKALDALRQGRSESARTALEAAWRLNESVMQRAEMTSQLIAVIGSLTQARVVRRVPDPPAGWAQRFGSLRFRDAYVTSMQAEAHQWRRVARGFRGAADLELVGDQLPAKQHVADQLVRLVTAPWLKLSAAGYSERLRLTTQELRAKDGCLIDLEAAAKAAERALSRWNVLGRGMVGGNVDAWRSMVTADLDAEMTRLVIEARRERSPQPGVRLERSNVCPSVQWRMERTADGVVVEAQGWRLPPLGAGGAWAFRIRHGR